MAYPDLSQSELEGYRNQKEIIRLTAEQTIKDFALFGLDLVFSGDEATAYEELFAQVNSCLEELIMSDSGRLMSLLYHIDISEKEIGRKFSSSMEIAPDQLTEIVLDRELKKVIVRKFFAL
jgi:hypothetical protein